MAIPDNNQNPEHIDGASQESKASPETLQAINILREIAGYTLTRDLPAKDLVDLVSDEVGVVAFPKNATSEQRRNIIDQVNRERSKNGQTFFEDPRAGIDLGIVLSRKFPAMAEAPLEYPAVNRGENPDYQSSGFQDPGEVANYLAASFKTPEQREGAERIWKNLRRLTPDEAREVLEPMRQAILTSGTFTIMYDAFERFLEEQEEKATAFRESRLK